MTKLITSEPLSRVQPPATIAITTLGRELRDAGRSIVSLGIGQPDFATPQHIIDAAHEAASRGETKYPPIGGIPELKAAVCDKFKRENQLDYKTTEVTISGGGKQILSHCFYATLNAGDEVILPAPYWLAYRQSVELCGATATIVDTSAATDFKITAQQLEQAITDKTRWLLINSPGNPTGSVYHHAELEALAEVLLRHPHVWVLSDDIYEHLNYSDNTFCTMAQIAPELRNRTLTVNGVSKAYAMTGWRIGYAAGPAELIKAMELVQSLWCAGTCSVSQWAAVAALNGPQDSLATNLEVYRNRRSLVVDALNAIDGMDCVMPDGAFYAYPSCASFIGGTSAGGQLIESDVDFCMALLQEQGVATVHGKAFGLSPNFRISYASSEEEITEAMSRIAVFCSGITRV
jgi:aspartate aminotransferase